MTRTLVALSLVCLASSPALAGKKKKGKAAPAAPVTLKVENACKEEAKVKLGNVELTLAGGTTSEEQRLTGGTVEDTRDVYELLLAGKSLGLYTFAGGGSYAVKIADCRSGHADVYTSFLGERPAAKSPQAAARVRFRARQNTSLEYRGGKVGRFKPLSVAMTSHLEIAGGEFPFTFRLRAAKRGPVVKMLNKTVKLEAGHDYLIEANVVGREVTFKVEDEGFGG